MGMLTGAMILAAQLWQTGDPGRAIDCGMVRWVDPNINSAARVVNLHPPFVQFSMKVIKVPPCKR